jgi:hypothetical protein
MKLCAAKAASAARESKVPGTISRKHSIIGLVFSLSAFANSGDMVRDTVYKHVEKVNACYLPHAKGDHPRTGEIIVTWEINFKGKVVLARVTQSLDPVIDECIRKQVMTWNFPGNRNKGLTRRVNYSFHFSKQGLVL